MLCAVSVQLLYQSHCTFRICSGCKVTGDMETAELLLSLILTVSFVLRVTDGQGEVTERVCVSYCIVIIYYRCYQIRHYSEHA